MIAFRKRLFDSVGSRKVHNGVIPRLGGVVFAPIQCCLLVVSMFFIYKLGITVYAQDPFTILFQFLLLMTGLLILSMVGIVDDLLGLIIARNLWLKSLVLRFSRFPVFG